MNTITVESQNFTPSKIVCIGLNYLEHIQWPGNKTQNDDYELMMYKPKQILQEITRFMSLNDSDLIMTGTPKAVGVVNAGDRFRGLIKSNDEVLVGQGWIAQ